MKQPHDIVSKLSELGYRLTPQRMMILSAIENSDDHISAEEIYAQVTVKYPNVNISTVYRTLELLKRLGLTTETDLGGGRVRYHPAAKGHHHHLVCQQCGAIIALDESLMSSLKSALLREYKFSADLRHLAIFGRCVNCGK
ncbi:MAG: Ferric uptake regulation protein [Syntrophomonadaceae bacterium]|nr:Ferric uptake regulation protein [Bacillota bacterium]MBT9146513.1 Ferric uptake regulation protein [Bacillota bacterium]